MPFVTQKPYIFCAFFVKRLMADGVWGPPTLYINFTHPSATSHPHTNIQYGVPVSYSVSDNSPASAPSPSPPSPSVVLLEPQDVLGNFLNVLRWQRCIDTYVSNNMQPELENISLKQNQIKNN